jgi:heavy metal sensor kinase
MRLTIRARLTIWYTLTFAAVLLLVIGVLALELYQQLGKEAHRALDIEETWITILFESEFLPLLLVPSKEKRDLLFAELPEDLEERYGLKRQFAFLRLEGYTEERFFSGGIENIDQLLPNDLLERQAGNYDVWIGKVLYRVRLFHREWGKVAVGVENDTIFKVAVEVGKLFVWVLPLSLLLTIGGGWLLAKLALRPVVAAAQAAESISVANLKERLQPYAGKDEFGALIATLNRMIARVEEGVKRLQQFTQDAAHELRTPIAILRGDLELAYHDEKATEETRAFLQKTLDRVIALGRIVDNLFLLARSDSGNYPVKKILFRLDAAVQEIFEDLQILANGRALTVHLRACDELEFFGDELLIRRLLMNLCENAVKYTPQGKIELALQRTKAATVFTISDTGEGIPAEDLPYIFDRFYRVDKSRSSASGGSGLGLAICQWIVAAHHGEISLSSSVGGGTTVRVSFPAKGV